MNFVRKWFPLELVRDLLLFRPKAIAVVKRAHIPTFKCWIGLHDWRSYYDTRTVNWKLDGEQCLNCRKRR